jgi:acetyl-CoA carboxylase biotin carboxyl carrier protein
MNLTNDDVREILRILETSSFDELRLETDRFKLTLRRAGGGWTQEKATAPKADAAPKVAATPRQSASAGALEPGIVAVLPPLMGTFYRAPRPGAAPFVEVGATVEEDSIVAIVETMKLMNSVPAGARGTVVEICAQNGEFVEQGQILMKLRVAS